MALWARSVCVAGRVVQKTQAAGLERESDECPASAARAVSGAAGLPPLQVGAEVGAKRRTPPHPGPLINALK